MRPALTMIGPATTPRGKLQGENVRAGTSLITKIGLQFNTGDDALPVQVVLPVCRKGKVDLNPPEVWHESDCEKDGKVLVEPQFGGSNGAYISFGLGGFE